MKKLVFLILLLIALPAASQTYLYTYVLTSTTTEYKIEQDTCMKVEDAPDIDDVVLVIYKNDNYYFRIWSYNRTKDRVVKWRREEKYTGVATYYDHPYSIQHSIYAGNKFILWLVPLKFTRQHSIEHLRAFVFTNDKTVVKTACKL